MVGSRTAAIVADDDEKFDTQALIRLAAWGLCAVVSVAVAVFAATSEIGSKRLNAALIAIASPPGEAQSVSAANLLVRTANAEREARRAAETVLAISADRERMAARVHAMEREVSEINGSVGRAIAIATEGRTVPPVLTMSSTALLANQKNPPPVGWGHHPQPVAAEPVEIAPSLPPNQTVAAVRTDPAPGTAPIPAAVPLPRPGPIAVQASASPPSAAAAPAPQAAIAPAKTDDPATLSTGSIGAGTPAEPSPAKVEFGVDLGPALTVGRLRSRWAKLSKERPDLVQGLRPVISVRDGPNKSVELRLVAGPLANVNAATDLCSALGTPAAGAPQYLCRPAVFDGQRLSMQ